MLALTLFLVAWAQGAPASDSIVPKNWLVIEPVDKSGRRPLRPDAVFAKHLLVRDAPPPQKGEVLRGENEKDCTWTEATAKDDGSLEGRIGWAYTAIESDAERVWMAKLAGASQLYVNGAGFVGDVYRYGFGGVPIALRKGRNDLYVGGVRGTMRLELWKPPAELFVADWDATLPDVLRPRIPVTNVPPPTAFGALLVVNASTIARDSGLPKLGPIRPLAIEKVPVSFAFGIEEAAAKHKVMVNCYGLPYSFDVALRSESEPRRSTFVSSEDDSVQEYAVRPASEKETAVVLSLHGAGVDCVGQINAYSSKPEFTIIAPTNRRQYGFDWQDWGRANAYETLIAEKRSIPHALYLTGHSMGGHGTWNLAANDPDAFAAIAPSAGWSSFDTYGSRPKGELAELWQDADASSRTLRLLDNLVQLPTYVLHGTKDDNVPLSEAERMEKALTDAGHPPQFHHQEGAGHWWDGERAPGADCVDWPEIFELFRKSPPRAPSPEMHFTTVDPGIDAGNAWLTVLQLERYGQPAEVKSMLRAEDRTLVIETKNVRRLQLGTVPGEPKKILVDGKEHVAPPALGAGEKSPEFSGPFKRAFRRHFVLVYGTQGTPEENRELLERARCDSEIWWYRGNGRGRLVSDTEYLQLKQTDSNAILYGNADTNLVWKQRVGASAPVQVHRGSIKLGEREWKGDDLCALLVYPSSVAGELFGLIGSTGAKATRLGYTSAYFVSGVGYPDYTIFGSDVLQKGDGGVRAAGWFDAEWKLDGHGFMRPEAK